MRHAYHNVGQATCVKGINHFQVIEIDSQTTDFTHFADVYHNDVTIKALKTLYGIYDVTTQKFANLLDVHSLMHKIKFLNSRVPVT